MPVLLISSQRKSKPGSDLPPFTLLLCALLRNDPNLEVRGRNSSEIVDIAGIRALSMQPSRVSAH